MLGAAKRQADAMRSAADHLAFLHAELQGSAAPLYDVPTAFEVLQTGGADVYVGERPVGFNSDCGGTSPMCPGLLRVPQTVRAHFPCVSACDGIWTWAQQVSSHPTQDPPAHRPAGLHGFHCDVDTGRSDRCMCRYLWLSAIMHRGDSGPRQRTRSQALGSRAAHERPPTRPAHSGGS